MPTLSENKKYLLNAITAITGNRPERTVGEMVYVDAYVSTCDLRSWMFREKRHGRCDNILSYKEIRKACDSLRNDGELIKAENNAGNYSQYAIPPTDGWVSGRTNFHKPIKL